MAEPRAENPEGGRDPDQLSFTHRQLQLFAHEVRAPLTVIAGYSEILRRPVDERERDRALDAIFRAVKRADRLIDDLLEGRLPDTDAPIEPEPLSLAMLAEETAEEQRTVSGRSIVVEAAATAPVRGSYERLEGALTNLIGNAVKYSPADTPISVRVVERGERAVVEVCDRGPGIPAADRERVLEPFTRLERDAGTQGSGVGLHVVRSVVEGHGGSVRIEDGDDGCGTRVVVDLPLAR